MFCIKQTVVKGVLFLSLAVGFAFAETPTVTLVPFSSSDNSYESSQRAREFSELLLMELMEATELEWVERASLEPLLAELGASASGMMNGSTALRLGAMTKADLLITGTFYRTANYTWHLSIQVIDLLHADTLVHVSGKVDAAPGPLSYKAELISQVCKSAVPALEHAAKKYQTNSTGVKLIAPMFFQNEEPGNRLDFYTQDLMKAIRKANKATDSLRFIQFPRADQAIQEAEMAVMGLTETDPDAWQKLADFYVWGSYRELDSSNAAFKDVKVKATITIWDGAGAPVDRSWTTKVSDLSDLSADIITFVSEFAKQTKPEHKNADIRDVLSAKLVKRAADIQYLILQTEYGTFPNVSASWLGRWQHVKQLLSVAAFLNPANEDIREALLIEQTRSDVDDLNQLVNNRYWRKTERTKAWKAHCNRFGWGFKMNRLVRNKDGRGSRTDNRLDYDTAPLAYIFSAQAVMLDLEKAIQKKYTPIGLPKDLPDDILAKWHQDKSEEYGNRLLHMIQEFPETIPSHKYCELLKNALKNVSDPRLKIALTDAMWDGARTDSAYPRNKKFFTQQITELYASAGMEREGIALLASAGQTEKKTPLKNRSKGRSLRRSAPAPATSSEEMVGVPTVELPQFTVSFKELFYVNGISALGVAGDHVWVGVAGQKRSLVQANALFSYNINTGSIRNMKGQMGDTAPLTELRHIGKSLWIGFTTDGVWEVDLETLNKKKFTARDGLPTHEIHDSSLMADRLFFCGGNAEKGVLCSVNLRSREWRDYQIPKSTLPNRSNSPACQIERISAKNNMIAAYCQKYGSFTELFIADTNIWRWKEIGRNIIRQHRPFTFKQGGRDLRIMELSMEDDGVWILTAEGLLFYSFEKDTVTSAHPIKITSALIEENRIWLSTKSGEQGSRLLAFDKQTKKWAFQTNISGAGIVSAITRDKDTLWLARKVSNALVGIDISTIAD